MRWPRRHLDPLHLRKVAGASLGRQLPSPGVTPGQMCENTQRVTSSDSPSHAIFPVRLSTLTKDTEAVKYRSKLYGKWGFPAIHCEAVSVLFIMGVRYIAEHGTGRNCERSHLQLYDNSSPKGP